MRTSANTTVLMQLRRCFIRVSNTRCCLLISSISTAACTTEFVHVHLASVMLSISCSLFARSYRSCHHCCQAHAIFPDAYDVDFGTGTPVCRVMPGLPCAHHIDFSGMYQLCSAPPHAMPACTMVDVKHAQSHCLASSHNALKMFVCSKGQVGLNSSGMWFC